MGEFQKLKNKLRFVKRASPRTLFQYVAYKRATSLGGTRGTFECPLCDYRGPFDDRWSPKSYTLDQQCPRCKSQSRHRLQRLVLNAMADQYDFGSMRMLHFAPEKHLTEFFRNLVAEYETADPEMDRVDHRVDMCNLPFDSESYDFVFASHVLEHIADDASAFSELARILSPDGIAVLPVPISGDVTCEYDGPSDEEYGHVRAPGLDYFEKPEQLSKIRVYSSDDFPDSYQTHVKFIGEWPAQWPPEPSFLRNAASVKIMSDFVPVFRRVIPSAE